MDRNQAIGLVLISALLITYFTFLAPKPEPVQETSQQEQVVEQAQASEEISEETVNTVVNDSLVDAIAKEKFGFFAAVASGEEKVIEVENENINISLNSKGGSIDNILLKDFLTYSKEPLVINEKARSKMSIFVRHAGRDIDIKELFYESKKSVENDTTIIAFTANLGNNQNIKQIYSIPPSGYKIGYDLQFNGISQLIDGENAKIVWDNRLKMQERDITISRQKSEINYFDMSSGLEEIGARSTDYEEESFASRAKWMSMKQKFFTSSIINEKGFTSGKISTDIDESDTTTVRIMHAELNIPVNELSSGSSDLAFYFGPNNYKIYKTVTEDFEDNLSLGWPPMKWVNKYVIIQLFHFFEKYISSYGIIIMLIVIVIKLALSPLSYKSYISMAKMKVMKPELDELKEKYGDDQAKFQQEQMKLFGQVGVNPLSGCVPMLLQMPILLAMFYFFPVSIELRQQSFLWAHDLSTYDSVLNLPFTIPFYGSHVSLFTLLMTASTILYTWSNNQMSTAQGPMKTMSYIMPIMFLFILNSFSAGLTFYYFVSNIVTFGQQAVIRRFVDDEKIKAILDENKKKRASGKKSKWRSKLDEAIKASQEAQQQQKKKKK